MPASSIVVSGNSAGKNLAVALLCYISDQKGVMPDPAAALLWSPWLNLTQYKDPGHVERNSHFSTDYLTPPFVTWDARAFIPDFMNAENDYISPYNFLFRTETPLWIQTGGLEVLREKNEQFAELIKGIHNNKINFYIKPDVFYNILLLGNMLGIKKMAENVAGLARKFLDSL